MGRYDMPEEVREAIEQDRLAQYACELQQRCDLYVRAMERGRKMWQEAHPEADYWPDVADMVKWLLEERVDAKKALERGKELLRMKWENSDAMGGK